MKASFIAPLLLLTSSVSALVIPFPYRKNLLEFDPSEVAAKQWAYEPGNQVPTVETIAACSEHSKSRKRKFFVTFINLDAPKNIEDSLKNDISLALDEELQKGHQASPILSRILNPYQRYKNNFFLEDGIENKDELLRLVVIPAPRHSSETSIPNRFFIFLFGSRTEKIIADREDSLSSFEPQFLIKVFFYERLSRVIKVITNNLEENENYFGGSKGRSSLQFPKELKDYMKNDGSNFHKNLAIRAQLNLGSFETRLGVEKSGVRFEKRKISDFSAMSYALQRLDGDAYAEDKESLSDSEYHSQTKELGIKNSKLGIEVTTVEEVLEPLVFMTQKEIPNDTANQDTLESDAEKHGNPTVSSNEEASEDEEPCVPVTWYTIFHHSVFGTPKLCVQ